MFLLKEFYGEILLEENSAQAKPNGFLHCEFLSVIMTPQEKEITCIAAQACLLTISLILQFKTHYYFYLYPFFDVKKYIFVLCVLSK